MLPEFRSVALHHSRPLVNHALPATSGAFRIAPYVLTPPAHFTEFTRSRAAERWVKSSDDEKVAESAHAPTEAEMKIYMDAVRSMEGQDAGLVVPGR